MNVTHPAAKMLVELSRAQDSDAGDGTTSVVVVAGALLEAAEKLLAMGIHPTAISDAFQRCATKAVEILTDMSKPIDLADRDFLIKNASTSLNSKVVSQQSSVLAPLAVDAVMKITEPGNEHKIDLKNIKIIKSLGGTTEDTEMVEGLVFTQRSAGVNGPKRIEKAKVGLIQFCISPPKTDVSENNFFMWNLTALLFINIFLKKISFPDGSQCNCFRLRSNGSRFKRGTCLHFEYRKTD